MRGETISSIQALERAGFDLPKQEALAKILEFSGLFESRNLHSTLLLSQYAKEGAGLIFGQKSWSGREREIVARVNEDPTAPAHAKLSALVSKEDETSAILLVCALTQTLFGRKVGQERVDLSEAQRTQAQAALMELPKDFATLGITFDEVRPIEAVDEYWVLGASAAGMETRIKFLAQLLSGQPQPKPGEQRKNVIRCLGCDREASLQLDGIGKNEEEKRAFLTTAAAHFGIALDVAQPWRHVDGPPARDYLNYDKTQPKLPNGELPKLTEDLLMRYLVEQTDFGANRPELLFYEAKAGDKPRATTEENFHCAYQAMTPSDEIRGIAVITNPQFAARQITEGERVKIGYPRILARLDAACPRSENQNPAAAVGEVAALFTQRALLARARGDATLPDRPQLESVGFSKRPEVARIAEIEARHGKDIQPSQALTPVSAATAAAAPTPIR